MNLPADPYMLQSYLNTKLRDEYNDLDALCDDCEIDAEALQARLQSVGLRYNRQINRVESA